RWTRIGGAISLGQLPGGVLGSSAFAVSYDGSAIVGYSDSQNSPLYRAEAFRWNAKTGIVGLGDLPGGPFASAARAVSADGSVIVGESWTEETFHAYRWSQKTGMVDLSARPDDAT